MRLFKITLILISVCTTVYSQDSISVINFKDIIVEFESLAPFDKEKLNKVFDQNAEFTAGIGESLESSTIIIKSDKYKDIEIYQAVETSLTISWEGPHCDLTNWKHFTSDWKKLKEIKSKTFKALAYDERIAKTFPDVSIQEIKKAVGEHCGEEWAKHVKDAKTIYDYPCDVEISKYYIRIKATNKTSGQKIEKTIAILIPMGC